MKKLYWRLKSWYYLKRHGVFWGRIADVAIYDQKHSTKSELLKGSDKSLFEAYKND